MDTGTPEDRFIEHLSQEWGVSVLGFSQDDRHGLLSADEMLAASRP